MNVIMLTDEMQPKENVNEIMVMITVTAFEEPNFGVSIIRVNGVGTATHKVPHHIFTVSPLTKKSTRLKSM